MGYLTGMARWSRLFVFLFCSVFATGAVLNAAHAVDMRMDVKSFQVHAVDGKKCDGSPTERVVVDSCALACPASFCAINSDNIHKSLEQKAVVLSFATRRFAECVQPPDTAPPRAGTEI